MYDVNKYVSVDVIEVNVYDFSRSSVAEEPDDEGLNWNIDKHAFKATLMLYVIVYCLTICHLYHH